MPEPTLSELFAKLIETIHTLPPTHKSVVLIVLLCGVFGTVSPWKNLLVQILN